jgi:molecular chaperone DnaK (HSP70)
MFKENDVSPNPEVLPSSTGEETTPSVICITRDSVVVGKTALDQRFLNPRNTFYQIKRFIGKSTNEEFVKEDQNRLKFKFDTKDGRLVIKVVEKKETTLDGNVYITHKDFMKLAPEQISAFVLGALKEDVDKTTGEDNKDCVITVPASFNEFQRRSTKEAALIAGLNPLAVINEPTAACIKHAYASSFKDEERYVLVYDYGGGTLDVSLVRIKSGEFTVLATDGDSHCGGSDIDEYLLQIVNKESIEKFGVDLNSKNDDKIMRLHSLILKECEDAKIKLTASSTADIILENYNDSGKILTYKLVKGNINEYFRGEKLEKILSPVKFCMTKLPSGKKITDLILVGGSSKIPFVGEKLKEVIGIEGYSPVSPDKAISEGAAIYGAYLKLGKLKGFPSLVIKDVTPMNIGICLKKEGRILIERNTVIPCESEFFATSFAKDSKEGLIRIFEGNDSDPEKCHRVGEYKLTLPSFHKEQIPYFLKIKVDSNGVRVVAVQSETKPKSDSEGDTIELKSSQKVRGASEIRDLFNDYKNMIIKKKEETINYLHSYAKILTAVKAECKGFFPKATKEKKLCEKIFSDEKKMATDSFVDDDDGKDERRMKKNDFAEYFVEFERKVKKKFPGYKRPEKAKEILKELKIDV